MTSLLVFTVLRDPAMTDTLMNDAAPPGTDITGNRMTALGTWTAAVASRRVIPVLLVLLASVPFAPMTLFTLALAFDS